MEGRVSEPAHVLHEGHSELSHVFYLGEYVQIHFDAFGGQRL